MESNIFFTLDFFYKYFALTAIFFLIAYFVAIISYYAVHRKIKFSRFRFTYRNYYIMTFPFVFPSLFLGFLDETFVYFLIFAYFGILGVVGETIFSVLWKIYFRKPFWEYKTLAIFNKFSSLLNFIPWGFGGFLFLFLTRFYFDNFGNVFYKNMGPENVIVFFLNISIFFLLQALFFKLAIKFFPLKKMFKKKTRIVVKYVYFTSFFLLIGILIPINYLYFLLLFLLYGIVAFFAEYFFGKMSKTMIGKKLWTYEYLTIDKKHTTPLNIFPFGLAGYYFFFLFLFLTFLFNL